MKLKHTLIGNKIGENDNNNEESVWMSYLSKGVNGDLETHHAKLSVLYIWMDVIYILWRVHNFGQVAIINGAFLLQLSRSKTVSALLLLQSAPPAEYEVS